MPLFVCYVPGFDLRYINGSYTPYTSGLLELFPYVRIKSYPCTELLPSILTGAYPQHHGKYQISLNESVDHLQSQKPTSRSSELVVTTLQCLYHLFDYRFDLPGIPAWRRRSFDLTTRFKFVVRRRTSDVLRRIGGLETIFSIVDDSRYYFTMKFTTLGHVIDHICKERHMMIFCEIHSLDILQLWRMDRKEEVESYYRHLDACLGKLHRRCRTEGMTLVLLVDRGMERTADTIDIEAELGRVDVAKSEYSYFIEPPMARFWFHTDRARSLITEKISTLKCGQTLTFKDLDKYHLSFATGKFGELFFVADAGHLIFPHDFYHPIGNIFLGLTDWKQRPRIADPRQRAVHGFLPCAESETGFMVVCDDACTAGVDQAEIIDVAPSLMDLLGCRKPGSMTGRSLFSVAEPPGSNQLLRASARSASRD